MDRTIASVLWLSLVFAMLAHAAEKVETHQADTAESADPSIDRADKSLSDKTLTDNTAEERRPATSYTQVSRRQTKRTSPLKSARYSSSEGKIGKTPQYTEIRKATAKNPRYAEGDSQATKEAPVTKGPEYQQGFVPSTNYDGKDYDGVPAAHPVPLAPGFGLNKGFEHPGLPLPVAPGFGYNKGFLPPGYGLNKGYGHTAFIPVALVPVYGHHGHHGYHPHHLGYHHGFGYGGPVKSVTYTKEIPVPVPHLYPVHVEKKVPYPVKIPVGVPIDRPVPVHVYKPVPVPVEKPVPYPVERPLPYPVKVPVKVPVAHPLPYPVPTPVPYPVYVKPVHGHGYYNDGAKYYDDYSGSAEHDGKSIYSDSKY